MNEHGKDLESRRKSQERRDLRNEGRVEDGKPPKTANLCTGHQADPISMPPPA